VSQPLPEALAGAALVLACITASWLDLKYRRLPNWLCAATAIVGLAYAAWTGGLAPLGSHSLHLAAALIVGMVLFSMGVFGGGDAKFYAAIAGWFALGQALGLLVTVSLVGLLLLVLWIGWRRLTRKPVRVKGGTAFDSLPYGVAIAGGALVSWFNLNWAAT